MPVLTQNAPGAAQQFRTSADYNPSPNIVYPTKRYCNRVTISIVSPGTAKFFLGLQAPQGVSSGVNSTAYDILLDASQPSFTIGPFSEGNDVDLGGTYFDGDTMGAKLSYAAVTR